LPFVEVENEHGASITVGEWVNRDDGLKVLRMHIADSSSSEYMTDCPNCHGSGSEPSGVEYMGSHEMIGCEFCDGTGRVDERVPALLAEVKQLRQEIELIDAVIDDIKNTQGQRIERAERLLKLLKSFKKITLQHEIVISVDDLHYLNDLLTGDLS
jgi:hypothetical protein